MGAEGVRGVGFVLLKVGGELHLFSQGLATLRRFNLFLLSGRNLVGYGNKFCRTGEGDKYDFSSRPVLGIG